MALPKQKEVEIPLLHSIEAMGGEVKPLEVYPKVTAYFPQITEDDLKETIAGGINKWTNRIQWARQSLVLRGDLERYPHGIWRITVKGRERLRAEDSLPKEAPRVIKEQATKLQPPKRHDELKQKMIYVGKKLGYHVSAEEGALYRHDVLWKQGAYKSPCHVIEICEGGSLPKDFDALHWANDPKNWGAKGILIVTDDKDFEKALKRFVGQAGLTAVKAETVDALCKIVDENPQFLELIFSKES
jgi:hypothetical protein